MINPLLQFQSLFLKKSWKEIYSNARKSISYCSQWITQIFASGCLRVLKDKYTVCNYAIYSKNVDAAFII